MIPVNYFAVLIAAIASMVLGFVWYGPLFGSMWIKMSKFSKKDMEKAKSKGMQAQYALTLVGSLLMSFVLYHSLVFASSYMKVSGVSVGLSTGFWNWLGFIVPVTLTSVLWEGKSWSLWILNNAYNLLSLLMMGVILSLMV